MLADDHEVLTRFLSTVSAVGEEACDSLTLVFERDVLMNLGRKLLRLMDTQSCQDEIIKVESFSRLCALYKIGLPLEKFRTMLSSDQLSSLIRDA